MKQEDLTEYQQGQLLHIHFTGEFKYRTDNGTKVPAPRWRQMLTALIDGEYVQVFSTRVVVTAKGREYLDAYHLSIKTLA